MVKVILQLYPQIRAEDEAERIALRPIGRNVERYQETIEGTTQIVKACDDLGVWGVSWIEHHFHSEGYEVGPNPGVLNAYFGAITKNLRLGQLGYVMSVQNPIRVAEETAVLDHLLKGRTFVGFARGYQARWTNTLGQHIGSRATLSDKSADDEHNRRIFEEQVDMVLDAWTSESIDHNSDLWQIPYPYDEGVDWFMGEWTKVMGAPGEIGEDGRVHRVSVVPAPYTQPHPPVFIASNASIETVQYAARRNFIPDYFTPIERAERHNQAYIESAKGAGVHYAPGQNQAVVRWQQIGDTEADARRAIAKYDTQIWKHFYSPVFNALPGEPLHTPRDAQPDDLVDPILHSGLWVSGTIDQVKDEYVRQWKVVPAEYITLIFHFAQMPADAVIYNLERFMKEVKPDLDELTRYEESVAAPAGD